ncbi:MAG TPA: ABC transporter ATP-binding protein [Thermodesulfobacteriota bacterium]|jgi:branched-chain amino acid transport system ATP-binding protein|nr:ABC transporter ATP-binding protein [Thermodesulfobacteriota bacterium]
MLTVKGVNTYYGGIRALKSASLQVEEGEVVALIGSNGAGKSTLLNCISGVVPIHSGFVIFDDSEITHLTPEKIVGLGVVQVPEGRQLFNPLTVLENLELGAYLRSSKGEKKEIKKDLDSVMELFPILKERRNQKAGTLSGGEQQMLSIGRAIMDRPKMMLLDEPSLGLAPLIVVEIFDVIRKLQKEGTTILLVEQNARAALKVATRGYVIETGRITLEGEAKALLEDKDVMKAYLGKDDWEKPNP